MLILRIIAAYAFVCGVVIGSAAAQTATASAPGQPVTLLQILTAPAKQNAAPPRKQVSKAAPARRLASLKSRPVHRAHVAQAATPVASDAAPIETTPPEPTSETMPAAVAIEPSELVVGGRTVQVVSPDDANEIDLAAITPASAPVATPAVLLTQADPAPVVVAASATPEPSPFGSVAWIAQVLAALGGAFAAGTVAWLMMGSAPQRSYG